MSQNFPEGSKYECKHVLYAPINDGRLHDMLLVKETVHLPDGTLVPNVRLLFDQPRPYWVTKTMFRNHEEKKEWEDAKKCDRRTSTQIALANNVARALGKVPNPRTRLKELARSPFLYGTDASPELLTKYKYRRKNPGLLSKHTVAILDTETDMIHGHEEIIMSTLSFKDKLYFVADRKFFDGIHDVENKVVAKAHELLGDIIAQRKIKIEIKLVDNAGAIAAEMLRKAHEWKPDIVAIWNITFDIRKMIEALEKYGYNLADEFCDPSVPAPFRRFEFIEGPAKKTSASGKTMSFDNYERWHVVDAPASFYFLDAMCVYWRIRQAKGKLASAKLDNILHKHLGIRKLKFEEANHLTGAGWHEFMQRRFKVEYSIYNMFDCISMELLDEKILDMNTMIGSLLNCSPYSSFASQPARLWNALQLEIMEDGLVGASTSDRMSNEFDEMVVDLKDWILTLPTHLMENNGIQLFYDMPGLLSYIRTEAADLDIEGTYPNGQCMANISRETTSRELVKIQGLDQMDRRRLGINLTGGHINAYEIAVMSMGAATLDEGLAAFMNDMNKEEALAA